MFPLWGHFSWISCSEHRGDHMQVIQAQTRLSKNNLNTVFIIISSCEFMPRVFWASVKPERSLTECVDSDRLTIWMPFRWGISWAVCLCFSYYLKCNNRHCSHNVLSVLYAAFVKFSFSFLYWYVAKCCKYANVPVSFRLFSHIVKT